MPNAPIPAPTDGVRSVTTQRAKVQPISADEVVVPFPGADIPAGSRFVVELRQGQDSWLEENAVDHPHAHLSAPLIDTWWFDAPFSDGKLKTQVVLTPAQRARITDYERLFVRVVVLGKPGND